ncbi:hypothetical protein SDC9_158281 [bioreactor metagenome]|uniref:Uncharacterized protein n=1 Tax=bioreactor metagenome TaxID=1076179 RepID=A0A645FF25_9ZZZZ
MQDRDNRAHHVQNHHLIDAVEEIAGNIAGDHLAALRHIEDLAAQQAQPHRDGDGHDHREDDAGDPPDLPIGHKDQSDLAGHGAQCHAEVQPHTGHDGNQQAEDQEDVAAHARDNLIKQIVKRKARDRNKHRADDDEHERNRVSA